MRALLVLLLALPLLGQTVKLSNHSQHAFRGWKRVTVDVDPPHATSEIDGTRFVMGRSTGRDTRALDCHVKLAPGETKTFDLATAHDIDFEIQPPHGIDWTGGGLQVNQHQMEWLGLHRDGACFVAHLHKRVTPMMHVDVWLRSYPDQPWMEGEMLVNCSNGSIPDLAGTMPKTRLVFGDAHIATPGRFFFQSIMSKTEFADGQARVVPFVALWARNFDDDPAIEQEQAASVAALIDLGISGTGIQSLLPDGNPLYPEGYSGRNWAQGLWQGSIARLHDWGPPVAGIAANSGQTGAQEDQLFTGGEPLLADWVGADTVNLVTAYKWANRCCHHLEASGARIKQADHPDCVFWGGRAHQHKGVSPDQLGKPTPIDYGQVPGGWSSGDREHWLVARLSAAARYSGSPALQAVLEHQANVFLFGETIDPRLSTSHSDAARSVGYAGIVAVQLWNNLADRQLAAQVRERFEDRVKLVYIPELGDRIAWDPRSDDRILNDLDKVKMAIAHQRAVAVLQAANPGGLTSIEEVLTRTEARPLLAAVKSFAYVHPEWQPAADQVAAIVAEEQTYSHGVMWWQQALGSYGLDLACAEFNIPAGRELALRAAKAVIKHAYRFQGGKWVEWDNTAWTGEQLADSEMVEGKGAHRTGWFATAWFPCAVATVLRHEPNHTEARAIWTQMMAQAKAAGDISWMAPGVN